MALDTPKVLVCTNPVDVLRSDRLRIIRCEMKQNGPVVREEVYGVHLF